MDLKQPLSFDAQVAQLQTHGLIVDDVNEAVSFLKMVSYYKFTGYTLQFRKDAQSSDLLPGHHFSEIRKLYEFDAELRQLLRGYLEIIEVFYKTQISNIFASEKCTTPPYDQHYDENNYYDKVGFNHILQNFDKECGYYADSLIVKHHKEYYDGKMPLWVMAELMSFSSVSKLYNAMYISSKENISKKLNVGPKNLENHLHCMSVLRNKCSHNARLLNTRFHPPVRLSRDFLTAYPMVDNASLFAYLLVLARRLPTAAAHQSFVMELYSLLQKYTDVLDLTLLGFPSNYRTILK
jgi:abortive infection bacteriophage resistance protein